MNNKKVRISEIFYSLQGEGVSRGVPAIFIRLPGCNLRCGGVGGKLVDEGKATWFCDSEKLWIESFDLTVGELWERVKSLAPLDKLLSGVVHIVWTGGEPLLNGNLHTIDLLMDWIGPSTSKDIFWEIETNGTIWNGEVARVLDRMNQVNCSPKLSNSGITTNKRIHREFLSYVDSRNGGWIKFVVSSLEDWEEIETTFLSTNIVTRGSILIMPAVDKYEDVQETSQLVWEIAQNNFVRMTLRDHVVAWGNKVGV